MKRETGSIQGCYFPSPENYAAAFSRSECGAERLPTPTSTLQRPPTPTSACQGPPVPASAHVGRCEDRKLRSKTRAHFPGLSCNNTKSHL